MKRRDLIKSLELLGELVHNPFFLQRPVAREGVYYGIEAVSFPDRPKFGKYRGKEVDICYGYDDENGKRYIRVGEEKGPELRGHARKWFLRTSRPFSYP